MLSYGRSSCPVPYVAMLSLEGKGLFAVLSYRIKGTEVRLRAVAG